jgi:hypothetical protein
LDPAGRRSLQLERHPLHRWQSCDAVSWMFCSSFFLSSPECVAAPDDHCQKNEHLVHLFNGSSVWLYLRVVLVFVHC